MAVDVATLVERVKAAVDAPGEVLFPKASDADWKARLLNAFWAAYLVGFFRGYHVDIATDAVLPDDDVNGVDLPQPDQHLMVMFAAYEAVRAQILRLPTVTAYTAGPVVAEIQHSAQVLQALLKDFKTELDEVRLYVIQPYGTSVRFFDNLVHRDRQLLFGRWLGTTGYGGFSVTDGFGPNDGVG